MNQEMTWLKASLRGDTAAFERIVAQYQSLVCSITLGATGRLDASEELAQETFLRAWKSLSQLKELDKFRSWLCTIARNCVQNYLRDQKRHSAVVADSAELAELTPSDSESIPDNLIRQEEEAMMQQALMRIPQDYRDVLILFYRQQQSVQKVAKLLELTESNVRTRLHRGRQLLRDEVASRIERTLERTTPGKQFTKAVMVAIGGLAVGTTATSQAATASSTVGAMGTSAILTGMGVKIAAAAAVIIIGAGVLVYYLNPPNKTQTVKPVVTNSFQRQDVTTQKQAETKEISEAVEPIGTKTKIVAQQIPAAPTIEKPQPQLAMQKIAAEPNDAYEFKPRGVLSGLITDADTGLPAVDVEVSIFISRYYNTKSDTEGFYYFDKIDENGSYRLQINSIDYIGMSDYYKMPTVNLQKDKQVVQHLKLKKACKLEVMVTDPNGRPIPDAEIQATVLSSNRSQEIGNSMYSRRTNKEGRILLGGFPPNDNYLITVTHNGPEVGVEGKPGYTQSFWDYAPAGLKIYLDKPGQIEYAEIVLEKGQSIKGIAKYKDGQPADDVKISAYPSWWHSNYCPQSAEVEPNGFFTLGQIVPGSYQIHVNIPTGEGSSTGYGLFTCTLPPENNSPLEVKVPFDSPKSLVSIRGTVKISDDGKPSYVEVNAFTSHGDFHRGRIGDGGWGNVSGEFIIDRLSPGNYTVRFSGPEIEEKTLENISAPSEGLDVELVYVGKPMLSGTVVDAQTHKPIREFQVRLKKVKTLRGPNYLQEDQLNTFVNDLGTFEIEAVGPGVYQVQAQAKGYAPAWSEEINTDRIGPVMVALTAGGASIRGIVLNLAGRPLKDVKVIPFSLAGGTDSTTKDVFVSDKGAVTTDEKGEFVLNNLAAGSETLKVTHSEYPFTLVRDIPAIPGRCTDNVKVILQQGGIVEGYVYDADGNPQEGVVIYAQDDAGYSGGGDEEAGRLGAAASDLNGFYRIGGLPQGICFLMRQNEWSAAGVVRRTIFIHLGRTSKVDFGGTAVLKGRVVLDGMPLNNQRLLLSSEGNPYSGNFKAYASTDSEGQFVVRGLVPGRLTVYYQQMEGRTEWIKIARVDSTGRDVDLKTIPQKAAEVRIIFRLPQQAWNITKVFLVPVQSVSESLAVVPPANSQEPYVIKPVFTGQYKLRVYRDDGLIFNHPVTVAADQQQIDLTIDLPAGNAKVYGTMSEKQEYVYLIREDKTMERLIIRTGEGKYEVSNLASGKYRFGDNLVTGENSPSFYLGDGQQLMMNIDEHSFEEFSSGRLMIQMVSSDGCLIEVDRIYLEANGRQVEPYTHSGSGALFVAQAGDYTLHIRHEGYKDFRQPVTLEGLKPGESLNPGKNKITIFLKPEPQ